MALPDGSTSRRGGSVLVAVAIVLVALNLRTAVISAGPVLDDVRSGLSLSIPEARGARPAIRRPALSPWLRRNHWSAEPEDLGLQSPGKTSSPFPGNADRRQQSRVPAKSRARLPPAPGAGQRRWSAGGKVWVGPGGE